MTKINQVLAGNNRLTGKTNTPKAMRCCNLSVPGTGGNSLSGINVPQAITIPKIKVREIAMLETFKDINKG